MAIIDKVQGTIEKLTGDDTRMNAAEITTIQQAYNAMQLGYIKTEFYLTQVQNPDVKRALEEVRDEFVKPNLEKPRRMLEKSGIPFLNLNVEDRVNVFRNVGGGKTGNVGTGSVGTTGLVLRDEEIILDSVLAMQATIAGLQAGALAAVRGDVRDYFLNARDAAMDQWRKLGMVAYRVIPQAIPPTMSGVKPQ
jgi:hypothetical protein